MKNKSGFTLIELLVVIVIIGILATIITAAVAGAMRSAKQSRIGMEMHTIATALEMYKTEFGEYPPDMFDDEALVRHVKKRWPRFELPAGTDVNLQANAIKQAISNVYRSYPPASKTRWTGNATTNFNFMPKPNTSIIALGFWLGGFPDAQTGKFVGFSADPEAPFGRRGDGSVNIVSVGQAGTVAGWYNDVVLGTPDKKTFIELEVGKNIVFAAERDGVFPCLAKKESENLYVPYVYFRGKSGGGVESYVYTHGATDKWVKSYEFTGLNNNIPATANWRDYGVVIAYASDGDPFALPSPVDSTWINAETYQLISPGLDTNFGIRSQQTTGNPYSDGFYRSFNANANKNTFGTHDLDNITNFSDFKPIKTIMK